MNTAAQQNQLCNQALQAEHSGQWHEAVSLYRQAIPLDPSNPTPYLFLGYALHQQGDNDRAIQAWSLATDANSLVINAWRNDALPEDIRQRSKLANELLRRHFTQLHQNTLTRLKQDQEEIDIGRIERAIWCQTHDQEFGYNHAQQKPHVFYVPELAPMPIIDRQKMSWAATLEHAGQDIRDEFLAAQNSQSLHPYLDASIISQGEQWRELAGTMNWSSLDLYKDGIPNHALIEQCPKTINTLEQIPILKVNGKPREVVFSVLEGASHIPPHFGLANTDATVHLPIVCAEQSAIRVVDTVTEWNINQVFAFDDSFEHESWNHSKDLRVNLLFEVWHPDLSISEREAIAACFSARQQWNQNRTI